jgi:hypothetical protein
MMKVDTKMPRYDYCKFTMIVTYKLGGDYTFASTCSATATKRDRAIKPANGSFGTPAPMPSCSVARA